MLPHLVVLRCREVQLNVPPVGFVPNVHATKTRSIVNAAIDKLDSIPAWTLANLPGVRNGYYGSFSHCRVTHGKVLNLCGEERQQQ
jgi:hypothetical protein